MALDTLSTVPYSISVDCVSATVHDDVEALCSRLGTLLGTSPFPGRPLPGLGYAHAAQLQQASGHTRALLMHGGQHDKPHVYAIGKEAYDSPALYEALQTAYAGRWLPSRLDLALDLDHPEAFDLVVPQFIAAATRRDMTLSQMGDWIRGKGRTLYVGARSSRSLIRVYEFNACHGYGPPCRIELQIRPKSSTREFIATRTPTELLYSSDVINVVVTGLDLDLEVEAGPLSPGARPPSDLDRKLNWLALQALPSLLKVLAEVGGDPVGLLDAIMARKAEIEAQRALCRSATSWHTPSELTHSETDASC
jgi:hypothetical protein